MSETARTLSKEEAKIVLELEWRESQIVTLAEVKTLAGGSPSYARFLAHRLVKKGWLERIRPGLYRLVPADRGVDGVPDTNPLATGALLVAPYFYSFGTACTHHGFTEQVFAEVYIACRVKKRPVTVHGTRYVFASQTDSLFFGEEVTDVLGAEVHMATKERALLDALDRPDLAGGIAEVSRIVSRAANRVRWPTVAAYARRWGKSACVQRLGYLLDLHGVEFPKSARTSLLTLVSPTAKLHLGTRARWGTSGPLARTWGIIENVPHDQLLDARRDQRRRREFPTRPR